MTKEILDVIAEYGYASVPLLQKQCALSYKQACIAIDELLQDGLVNFSDKLIYTINQSKFFKAYGEFCDNSADAEEYSGELVADNAKLSKYVMEFYKKALLHIIRSGEVRLIDIAVTFHVNPVITTRAVAWMKQNGYIEQKPNKLAKVLITEKQFFEKFGRIREYNEKFEDMYGDAVLLCIKHKSFDRSLIASNFVASNQQLADFDAWLEKNGYKQQNAETDFERIKEKFFKMCNVCSDTKNLSTLETLSFDDDDEDDDDYDEDEIDEEEIRKILEGSFYNKDIPTDENNGTDENNDKDGIRFKIVETDDGEEVYQPKIEVYKDVKLAESSHDTVDKLIPKMLLFCMENSCVSELDLRLAFPVSKNDFYHALQRLTLMRQIFIEPELQANVSSEEFIEQYGAKEQYRIPRVKDTVSVSEQADKNYTDEFVELCKLALWYCVKNDYVSHAAICQNVTLDFNLTYEAVHWMRLHGYVFENDVRMDAVKFEKEFGDTAKYEKRLSEIKPTDYSVMFKGKDVVSESGKSTLYTVKSSYEEHFSAVFSDYDSDKGIIKTSFLTTIDFRLRTDGARIYLSDCGYTVNSGEESAAKRIASLYENVYLVGDELVVEFIDPNYAGVAMLTLYAVIERIIALRF